MKIFVLIIEINEYKTFFDMIRSNGLENVLPGIRNIDEGVSVYMQYYNKEIESQCGVVGIKVLVYLVCLFSVVIPLYSFLEADINCPVLESRFTKVLLCELNTCVRSLTAPIRYPSLVFLAIIIIYLVQL